VRAARRSPFQYAIVRLIPDLARGECLNAGVIVMCRTKRFLGARVHLDEGKLAVIAPTFDPTEVRAHLGAIERVAAGEPGAGPIAALGFAERFHWLVAPASTIIQVSPVHTGLCSDPAAEVEHLFAKLVV